MRKPICILLVIFVLCVSFAGVALAEEVDSTRFVFAGHIRGPINFTINSLLPYFIGDVKDVDKDFVIIGGLFCDEITIEKCSFLDKLALRIIKKVTISCSNIDDRAIEKFANILNNLFTNCQ